MENKIYSISEAFSMQPRYFCIGDCHFIGADRETKTLVDRIEHVLIQTGDDQRTEYYVGYDKDNYKLFKYRADTMNVQYY